MVVQMKHFDVSLLRAHFGIEDVSQKELVAADKKRKAQEDRDATGQRTLEVTLEASRPPAYERTMQANEASSSEGSASKRTRVEASS